MRIYWEGMQNGRPIACRRDKPCLELAAAGYISAAFCGARTEDKYMLWRLLEAEAPPAITNLEFYNRKTCNLQPIGKYDQKRKK